MKDKVANLTKRIKEFFVTHTKMKMLVAYLVLNLLYLTLGSYIFMTKQINPKFTYEQFAFGLKNMAVLNMFVFLVIFFERKYKKNWAHLFIIGIVIVCVISTHFAIDKQESLRGCFGRYEGLYSVLYYLSVALLSTFVSKKYKKFLVHCILACGTFQAFYSICQSCNWLNVKHFYYTEKHFDETTKTIVKEKVHWVVGLTNNSNFLGTYMSICLAYSFGLLVESKKIIKSIVYCILSAIFLYALMLSNTTSAAVGSAVVAICIFIYAIRNKKFIKLLVIGITAVCIIVLTYVHGKTSLIKDVHQTGVEVTEISKGNYDDSFGTRRMFIWKETIKVIPEHFWHGVGIDSFDKAFNGEALVRKTKTRKVAYDKAHNEYLQILITYGVFGFVAYVWLYGYAVCVGIKRSLKKNEIYLVLPVICYLVQAAFNISVLEVAPIFFIALGLCCGKIDENQKDKKVVLTYGTFDLLHYGHIRLLERAKNLGDYLIVAVSTDEFNELKGKKAFYDYETRRKMVEVLKFVDLVIPESCWEQKPDDIKKHNVDIVVMGSDWKDSEKFECLKDYCEVIYLDRTEGISSSKIKERIENLD